MTEKILHPVFTAFSWLVHFTLICCIISIPVFLIYQGDTLPTFTASVASVTEVSGAEELPEGLSANGQYSKIEYNCTADAGRFNPYTFRVTSFEVSQRSTALNGFDYAVTSDSIEFRGGPDPTDFSITVYVNADETTAEEIADSLSFHTVNVTEGFSAVSALIVNGYTFSVQ